MVVAEESEGTTEPIGKVKMSDPVLSIVQKAQLQAILDEFSDVITIELGSVKGEVHVILTDGSPPVRSVPYRIAPGWRQDLKEEIQQLVREGALYPVKVHGLHPWCLSAKVRQMPSDYVLTIGD